MTISALLSRRFDEHRKLSASRIPARLKILLAKVGFDGHDRGIKILTSILREHGHEVVYLGKYLTVAVVVEAAIPECSAGTLVRAEEVTGTMAIPNPMPAMARVHPTVERPAAAQIT